MQTDIHICTVASAIVGKIHTTLDSKRYSRGKKGGQPLLELLDS